VELTHGKRQVGLRRVSLSLATFAVTKVPPPVLGFNNNVRHRGRIFHIQTEDSGVRSPRIVTHLFADGGRIIKTIRTDYTQELERPDLAAVVRQLMKSQHKAMFLALRAGDLDQLLEAACGPLPPRSPRESGEHSVVASTPSSEVRAAAEVATSAIEPAAAAPFMPVSSPPVSVSEQPSTTLLTTVQPDAARNSNPIAARKPRVAASPFNRSERPTLSRPASRYGSAPANSAHSIFGDGVISEKSLDEVILSYLAEDLDGSSE
jgi:hypothetical protein